MSTQPRHLKKLSLTSLFKRIKRTKTFTSLDPPNPLLDLPFELLLLVSSHLCYLSQVALALAHTSLYTRLKPTRTDLDTLIFDTPFKRGFLQTLYDLNFVPQNMRRLDHPPRSHHYRPSSVPRDSAESQVAPLVRPPPADFEEWVGMTLCTRCERLRDGGDPRYISRQAYWGRRHLCWECKQERQNILLGMHGTPLGLWSTETEIEGIVMQLRLARDSEED